MILHLVSEHNATSDFLKNFERIFPQGNVVMKFGRRDEYKKVEVTVNGEVKKYKNSHELSKEFDFSRVTIVVVHFLNYSKERFLLKYISNKIPIVWWMYGGDLYTRLQLIGYEVFAHQTLPFVKEKSCGLAHRICHFLIGKRNIYVDKKIIKRICAVIPCEQPDYKLACLLFGRNIDLVDIYPRGINNCSSYSEGCDICIGHSAALSCNHLYALDIIKKVDLGNSDIWLPLSYTINSEKYKDAVVTKFMQQFGDRVHFIYEYQDIDTYLKNFLRYKIAIYPSWRQEALGNIFICFQLGIKVFLSIHNPCFSYYKEMGYLVYSLEDINSNKDLLPLTSSEKVYNRRLFYKIKEERDKVAPSNLVQYFSKYV